MLYICEDVHEILRMLFKCVITCVERVLVMFFDCSVVSVFVQALSPDRVQSASNSVIQVLSIHVLHMIGAFKEARGVGHISQLLRRWHMN